MAIAIRDDVATYNPYYRLIERLLREKREVRVFTCPEDHCRRSVIVFFEKPTNLAALEHHVRFFLARTHPDHDAICSLNEDLPAEVENPIAGGGD